MATLKDIAADAGVSVSVVSRALNPRPDGHTRIAPETRGRIEAAANRLGFRRNRAAEFMRRGQSPTIGVFVPASANRLMADLIFGISEVLGPESFPLQIAFHDLAGGFRNFLRHNRDFAHSGVISYSNLLETPAVRAEVQSYVAQGGRLVMLNTPLRLPGTAVVAMDEVRGGRLAGERLLARDSAKFATVGAYQGRLQGFAAAGISATAFGDTPRDLARLTAFCRGASAAAPVGVFAVTDILALRVCRAVSAAGLVPGRDVLVVGYDDLALAAETNPALTTIHQPFREEGQAAARKLLELIYGGTPDVSLINPWLVTRESA